MIVQSIEVFADFSIDIPPIEETSTHHDILVLNHEEDRPLTHASNRSISRSISPSEKKESIILPEQPL